MNSDVAGAGRIELAIDERWAANHEKQFVPG
jgi:hypothetical protein